MSDWHSLSHEERNRICRALGRSADQHFRSTSWRQGIPWDDLMQSPVLIAEIGRLSMVEDATERRTLRRALLRERFEVPEDAQEAAGAP